MDALLDILGREWVTERIATLKNEASTAPSFDEGRQLLSALEAYPRSLETLRKNGSPSNADSWLFLAMVAFVACECAKASGGQHFTKKLRDLARAGEFGHFFDTLFEGEAAVYWRDQMQARSIEFPDGNHPDFWANIVLQGHELRIANECKRVSPVDRVEAASDALSARLEQEVRKLQALLGALKVIVWLHVPAAEIDVSTIVDLLRTVTKAAASSKGNQWHTDSDATGTLQVSIALDREHGEWREQQITIDDVPAVGPLRVSVETRYFGTPQDPRRLKYVLSVRSDVLPNRIGAFEKNLVKALRQVTLSKESTSGVVNVRIRPPRALGDLFEADGIVRRVLRDKRADHIGLVILFWNEGDREEGDWEIVDRERRREVIVKYALQAHFIASNPSPIDFRAIDSAKVRFPAYEGIPIRDPETGSLAPISQQLLELVKTVQPSEIDITPDSENAATIYMRLHRPFPAGVSREIITPVRTKTRVFLPTFDDAQHLRVIEFEGREPLRVATMDLRAWGGEIELLFHLKWESDPWMLSAPCPRSGDTVVARSVPLRRAFL